MDAFARIARIKANEGDAPRIAMKMSLKGDPLQELKIDSLRAVDLQRLAVAMLRQTTPGVSGGETD